MQESKKAPGNNPEETPEQIKQREELAAQAEKDKAEKAKIKAAQTRVEPVLDKDGKPTKETKEVQSKLLPKETERHLFHVELETPAFHPQTGKRLSKSKVQIFNPNEFSNFKNNAQHLGLEMKILWNPEQYK